MKTITITIPDDFDPDLLRSAASEIRAAATFIATQHHTPGMKAHAADMLEEAKQLQELCKTFKDALREKPIDNNQPGNARWYSKSRCPICSAKYSVLNAGNVCSTPGCAGIVIACT